jgi:hypothetical protein
VLHGESITIRNNSFEAHVAYGGGMYAVKYGDSALVNLTRAVIEDNQVSTSYIAEGGGLYLEARVAFREVEIRGNAIRFTAAVHGHARGGGVYVRVVGTWSSVLERVAVEGNGIEHARVGDGELRGGGISWWGNAASTLVCSLCEIRGNTLRLRLPTNSWSSLYGAGMESSGRLVMNDTLITGVVYRWRFQRKVLA